MDGVDPNTTSPLRRRPCFRYVGRSCRQTLLSTAALRHDMFFKSNSAQGHLTKANLTTIVAIHDMHTADRLPTRALVTLPHFLPLTLTYVNVITVYTVHQLVKAFLSLGDRSIVALAQRALFVRTAKK
jgi:hypothetical protein